MTPDDPRAGISPLLPQQAMPCPWGLQPIFRDLARLSVRLLMDGYPVPMSLRQAGWADRTWDFGIEKRRRCSNHPMEICWLVVTGTGLIYFSIQLGISSPQLMNAYCSERCIIYIYNIPVSIGWGISSSQLTNSFFNQGWLRGSTTHQNILLWLFQLDFVALLPCFSCFPRHTAFAPPSGWNWKTSPGGAMWGGASIFPTNVPDSMGSRLELLLVSQPSDSNFTIVYDSQIATALKWGLETNLSLWGPTFFAAKTMIIGGISWDRELGNLRTLDRWSCVIHAPWDRIRRIQVAGCPSIRGVSLSVPQLHGVSLKKIAGLL